LPYDSYPMKTKIFASVITILILSSCSAEEEYSAPSLEVTRMAFTSEPIESETDIPEFKQFFETGSSVIYSYIWFQNTETLTGAYKTQISWFYPNDLRPPIARHVIDMEPNQNIAQFSLHNEEGLNNGPYKIIVRSGLADGPLSASGSSRIFIGMSKEDSDKYLEEEAEFLKKREIEKEKQRIAREAEEARKAALSGSSLSGSTMSGEDIMGLEDGLVEGLEEELGELEEETDLPPDLVGEVE